jgi:hypothetical protein
MDTEIIESKEDRTIDEKSLRIQAELDKLKFICLKEEYTKSTEEQVGCSILLQSPQMLMLYGE